MGDLRYAVRLFRKSPAFSAAALAALSVGMGAATAIFSVVDAVLLKALPFPQSDRLVVLWEKKPAGNNLKTPVALANFLAWQQQVRSLGSPWARSSNLPLNLVAGPNGRIDPEEIKAENGLRHLFPGARRPAGTGAGVPARGRPSRATTTSSCSAIRFGRAGSQPTGPSWAGMCNSATASTRSWASCRRALPCCSRRWKPGCRWRSRPPTCTSSICADPDGDRAPARRGGHGAGAAGAGGLGAGGWSSPIRR